MTSTTTQTRTNNRSPSCGLKHWRSSSFDFRRLISLRARRAHTMPNQCPLCAHSVPTLCPLCAHSVPTLCPMCPNSAHHTCVCQRTQCTQTVPKHCPWSVPDVPALQPFQDVPTLCPLCAQRTQTVPAKHVNVDVPKQYPRHACDCGCAQTVPMCPHHHNTKEEQKCGQQCKSPWLFCCVSVL